MSRPPAFLDHIIIQVADLSRSLEFYRAALKPLGAEATDVPGPPESSWGPAVVLGPQDAEDLALVEGEPTSPPLHLAFVASNPEAARWFEAYLAAWRSNASADIESRYSRRTRSTSPRRTVRPDEGSGRSSKGGSVAPTIRATGTFATRCYT